MNNANSEEAPLKARNDDSLDRIKESLQKVRNNLALASLPFPERYHRGKLDVHIHLGVRVVGPRVVYTPHSCILLEGDRPSDTEGPRSRVLARKSNCVVGNAHEQDCPVLVDVREFAQETQQIIDCPSTVRLIPLDECECFRVNAPIDGDVSGVPLVVEPRTEERESSLVGGAVPHSTDELPGEMVEGSADVLDAVAYDEGGFGRDSFHGVDQEFAPRSIVVNVLLFPKRVGMTVLVPPSQAVKFVKMHLCSAEFCPNARQ